MQEYDVAIIGAGPGGYVAALRCAQLGLKTAVVEDWRNHKGHPALGGTCLNVGCIPSKALLDSSHKFYEVNKHLHEHGIQVEGVSLDVATMMQRKNRIVEILTGGVAALFAKHKIAWIKGRGSLNGDMQVRVTGDGEPTTIKAGHIIIATGSRPTELSMAPFDGDRIVDSTDALAFDTVPKQLAVIGGGVIGLELGSVWQRLGSEVTVLVRGDTFLRAADHQIAQEAQQELMKQGLDIRLRAVPTEVKVTRKGVSLQYESDGETKQIRADKVLVAVGRTPYTEGLGLEKVGLEPDERGFIPVDECCRTSHENIWAIGDVVRGPMLAHKASEEGVMVAERIAGQQSHMNYRAVPWVIYTHPEIAWVGATSQELRRDQIEFKSGTFPFKGNGRAHAMGSTGGLVKILSDSRTDRILGIHIIGPNASEMIAEAVIAVEFDASAEDIARTIHAHPTLSEAFHEAALAVDKRALHI